MNNHPGLMDTYTSYATIKLLSECIREIYKVAEMTPPSSLDPKTLAADVYKAIEEKVKRTL